MANTQPYEVIAGPADVFFAPTGSTFPATTEQPGTAWKKVGYTDGGVKVASPQTVVALRADQVTGPIKAVRSEEDLQITFGIASVTLANYALALNQAIAGPTDGSGDKSVKLYRGGSQVETLALLVRNDHLSPYGDFPLQFEVPVCYQSGNPEVDFVKDNKSVLACQFDVIVDPNRDNDGESFGRVRAGDGT